MSILSVQSEVQSQAFCIIPYFGLYRKPAHGECSPCAPPGDTLHREESFMAHKSQCIHCSVESCQHHETDDICALATSRLPRVTTAATANATKANAPATSPDGKGGKTPGEAASLREAPPPGPLPKRGEWRGDAGGEAASLREAPLPQTPSPEEWLGIGLRVPSDLYAHASWARFLAAGLWSRRLLCEKRLSCALKRRVLLRCK